MLTLVGGLIFGGQVDGGPFQRRADAVLRVEQRKVLRVVARQVLEEVGDRLRTFTNTHTHTHPIR